jgi:hypothetical protein
MVPVALGLTSPAPLIQVSVPVGSKARAAIAPPTPVVPPFASRVGGLPGTFRVNATSIKASTVTLPPRSTLCVAALACSALPWAVTEPCVDLTVTTPPVSTEPPRPLACTENGGAALPSIRMSPRANRSIQLVPTLPPPPVSAFSSALGLMVSVPPDQISMHAVVVVGLSGWSGPKQ